jgi:leucyl aminopeptidase
MTAKLRAVAKLDFSLPTIYYLTKEQAEGKSKVKHHLPSDVYGRARELNRKGLFSGESCSTAPVQMGKGLALLVGLGEQKDNTLTGLRIVVKSSLFSQFLASADRVNIFTEGMGRKELVAVAEGVLLGSYAWDKYVTKDAEKKPKEKTVHVAGDAKLFERAAVICGNVNYARDMVNENADVMNSAEIEKRFREAARAAPNSRIEVLDRAALKAKGLNMILAVNSGSRFEPRLVIVKYANGGKSEPYTAFVGKGVTFDSGGLDLKPGQYMTTMREDMAGSAAVLALLRNAAALKVRKNLIFAAAVVENAIGSKAFKPGDVIKSYDGKTVEIESTDAEGRLILADANAYVGKNYKPGTIINIATLTGAVSVALGPEYTGLMSNDQGLANRLLRSAGDTDDRAWQLPIYKELEEHVKSKYADIRNLGLPKGEAGVISGGEFLRQFVPEKTKWAHLDIGGTNFVEGDSRWHFGYGGTGAGIRLLTDFMLR